MIPPEVAVASLRRLPHLLLLAEQFAILPFLAAVASAMMPGIGARDREDGDMADVSGQPSEWEISIPYNAQFDVNGEPVCTEGTIRLRGNGTWYLRLTIVGGSVPVIELAGDHTSPVGVIRETIEATVSAARSNASDESSPSS
jgi:hypothetical protein